MTGFELFHQEIKKREFTISEVDVSKGKSNGEFIISNKTGKSSVQNFKTIAELYGIFAFYHFEPDAAINQIFELIELSFDNP